MQLAQLFPASGATTVDDLLSDLRLSERAADGRPYLVLNMVASIDGRTTLGGHVGELTGTSTSTSSTGCARRPRHCWSAPAPCATSATAT